MERTAGRGRHEIRPYGAADWRRLREIRLEMLADTPIAYVEWFSDASQYADERWQERAAWAGQPHHLGLAVAAGDRWVGLACCSVLGDRPVVFSVYLAPAARGQGVADELFDRVEDWARAEGHPDLYLHVHEHNARAAAFYRRRGYLPTGTREPYPLNPTHSELELRLPLGSRVDGVSRRLR